MRRLFILFTFIFLLSNFYCSAQGSGYALNFDGSSDYIAASTNGYNSGNSFSVELWLKPTSIKTGVHLWEGDNLSNPSLEGNSNSLNFWLSNTYSLNTGILVIGEWYHIVATYNKTTQEQTLYVNGVSVGQNINVNASPSFGNNLYICDRQNGGHANNGRDFPGTVDEVRIWNRALTPLEIQENMCQKLAGTEPDLVAYYRMDEGVDNTCSGGEDVCDLTGNGNNGTKY